MSGESNWSGSASLAALLPPVPIPRDLKMKTRFLPLVVLLALLSTLGGRAALAAGSIRVSVSPNVLLADGISTATITAEVRNSSGRPARDGTEVRFYTTAGAVTQIAFTSAGVARATLTASSVPQAANVSVSAGIDQTVLTVPMVSKLVEASVGGRVMKITGQYVAFSEDKRYIQADGQVKLRFRGVELEANSVQVDLTQDTVIALGKVNISSDENALVGERLWLSLKTFEGYIVAVGAKKWFSAYGLTDLPEKPKNLSPSFDLVDLADSKLIWVSKQANYIVGERVQVQGARAYVGGIKSLRMPYHEAELQGGFGGTEQYVGIGTEGLTIDLPLYVRMSPNASTAFRIGYGARSGGLGYFSREKGLSVDLVQKYGFSGSSEGEAVLSNLTSFDRWGFAWAHTQQLNKTTRLVSNLQFPEHRDMYGSINLTSGLPFGTAQVAMAAVKPRGLGLAKTVSLAFETKPKPVVDGKLMVSAETSFFRRDAQTIRPFRGVRIPTQNTQYQTLGLKVRPATVQLAKGLTLDSSASLRGVSGGRNAGFGPALEMALRKTLPNNGSLSVGVNYNHLATISDFIPTSGKMNATLNATYPVSKRFRISAMGMMALDAESRHSIMQASYQLSPAWRVDLLHTFFKFGEFGDFDYQLGVARALGNRELSFYWSRREHRFMVEFGAARF
jgi:hypothetical protein